MGKGVLPLKKHVTYDLNIGFGGSGSGARGQNSIITGPGISEVAYGGGGGGGLTPSGRLANATNGGSGGGGPGGLNVGASALGGMGTLQYLGRSGGGNGGGGGGAITAGNPGGSGNSKLGKPGSGELVIVYPLLSHTYTL